MGKINKSYEIWLIILSFLFFASNILTISLYNSLQKDEKILEEMLNRSIEINKLRFKENYEREEALANYFKITLGYHEIVKVKKEEQTVGVWYVYPTQKSKGKK